MFSFHKKTPEPIRPLPAGIPILASNTYSNLRKYIEVIIPIVHEQQKAIKSHNDLETITARQERILGLTMFKFWGLVVFGTAPWLGEINDVRVSMEMKLIQARRRKNNATIEDPIREEKEREYWSMYLENYDVLLYLMNRMLRELADYEYGTRWWIENGLPILQSPYPPAGGNFVTKPARKLLESEKGGEEKVEEKKAKKVSFDKHVVGWYFNDNDTPFSVGRGDDEKSRKKAEFTQKLMDDRRNTYKALVQRAREHYGYTRCSQGFGLQKASGMPEEYRITYGGFDFSRLHTDVE